MKFYNVVILLIPFLSSANILAQDKIYTVNNNEILTKIHQISSQYIFYYNYPLDSMFISAIPLKQVSFIVYESGNSCLFNDLLIKNNIVSFNITDLGFNTISFSYEKFLRDNVSIKIPASFRWKVGHFYYNNDELSFSPFLKNKYNLGFMLNYYPPPTKQIIKYFIGPAFIVGYYKVPLLWYDEYYSYPYPPSLYYRYNYSFFLNNGFTTTINFILAFNLGFGICNYIDMNPNEYYYYDEDEIHYFLYCCISLGYRFKL